jgi:hypothetical protein
MLVYTTHIFNYTANGYKDVTIKSGDERFSPTWQMVWNKKMNIITEEEFAYLYINKMKQSMIDNKQVWLELCNRNVVSLACYCDLGKFCHRNILVGLLEEFCIANGIEFIYLGEI